MTPLNQISKEEIEIIDGKVFILGKEYPPTQYNLNVWREYQNTGDKSILQRLSTVVLDLSLLLEKENIKNESNK